MVNQRKAVLYALGAVGLWSTIATAFKIALTHVSPLQLLAFSSFVSFLFFFVIITLRGRIGELAACSMKEYLKSAGLGFLNPFLYYLVLFEAYSRLLGQEALVLNYTWPIVLVLLSVLILRKRINLKTVAALVLSFFGVAVIAGRGSFSSFGFSDPLGIGLAVGSSLVWALFWLFNVKDRREDVLKLCLNFAFGFIYSIIVLAVFGEMKLPVLAGSLAVVYVGLFEMGLTFVLWLSALKLAESTAFVSNLVFLSPFISLFLLHVVLGEELFFSTILGLVIIIAGILIQRYRRSD